jgi:hypothetical protein
MWPQIADAWRLPWPQFDGRLEQVAEVEQVKRGEGATLDQQIAKLQRKNRHKRVKPSP